MRKRSQKQIADDELEAFARRGLCRYCKMDGNDDKKEHFVFRGEITYFCPIHQSFQEYFKMAGKYWRRHGEQDQN